MTRQTTRKVGRPNKKGAPLADRFVGFDPDVMKKVEDLAEEQGISFPEYVRRAVDEKLNPIPVVISNDELESAPLLDVAVACGPGLQGSDSSRPFVVSRQTADVIMLPPGGFMVRARGESMEGAGIFDEYLVAMAELKEGRLPRRGEIALIKFTKEDEEPTGTIKRWDGVDSNGFPKLLDGAGEPFPIPEGWGAEPIAIAKGVMGEL